MNTSSAYNIGSDIANNILANNSAQDIVENMDGLASLQEYFGECQDNYMSQSPFEFIAHEINEHDNVEELWTAFDNGFYETIESSIDTVKKECLDTLSDMMQYILDELEENNIEQYDELLLDCNGMVSIGSLEYDPARVLRELDPIAYREGYLDYINCIATDNDELERLEEIKDKILTS